MRRCLLACWCALALLTAQPAEARERASDLFRRGVSVHTMLNWARLASGERELYAQEPFSGEAYDLPETLIGNVKRAGFDFVRLTVDPGPFLQLEGAARAALDRKLVATVERFLAAGLAVMVDLHSNTHVPRYDPVNWLTSTDDPVFVRYVALVGRTAGLLAGLGTRAVAIEPMNEPPYGYDPASVARWQTMAEMMHAAVRRAAPDLLVVLSGAQGGSRNGLADFDPAPFRGSRVLFSFHYYEPYMFTHEGVESNEGSASLWRYLSAMPYPAASVPTAEVLATVKLNIDRDATLDSARKTAVRVRARADVLAYRATRFGPGSIDAAFDGVLAWARRHEVDPDRIFLGEFGVTRTYGRYRAADPRSREAWLRDVRKAAEARGFGWCLWSLSGYGGMALVTEDGATTLDPGTLRALGLDTPGR